MPLNLKHIGHIGHSIEPISLLKNNKQYGLCYEITTRVSVLFRKSQRVNHTSFKHYAELFGHSHPSAKLLPVDPFQAAKYNAL